VANVLQYGNTDVNQVPKRLVVGTDRRAFDDVIATIGPNTRGGKGRGKMKKYWTQNAKLVITIARTKQGSV
jgi:hypothetical protein